MRHFTASMPGAILSVMKPRVTLVMTVRERYRLTLRSIEDILAKTPIPYRFIFSHGVLPAWLDEALAGLEKAGRLERRFFPDLTWPQHLRRAVLDEIDTEFTAFIDNDILVSEGWLERLLQCADETGAGVVGPVYLWGDGDTPPKVHMAGGMLHETLIEGRPRLLKEVHGNIDGDPAAVLPTLKRGPCDFVEFHCMLVRTALARAPGIFDPEIVAVHEHINTCLGIKALGGHTVLEPAVQVTYLAHAEQILEDLPLMRSRWDDNATEASIQAFCRKWNVDPDNRSWGGVRGYSSGLRWKSDPLRPRSIGDGHHLRPMTRGELPQTRSALIDLALARGYGSTEVALLARTCAAASLLFDGGYRPCGRPFLNHVIGTAGALVNYDFCIECVCEGLLHSAYTHRRLTVPQIQEVLTRLHPQIELRVRMYTQRQRSGGEHAALMSTTRDTEIAAIEAANEIDMRISGEYAYSGRSPEISADVARHLAQHLEIIGVPGMARTMLDAIALPQQAPAELVTRLAESYRIGPGNTLVPMANR
jgi:hypothetical protein